MDLATSMMVAASGMRAQSTRMRTIAENIANANSTSTDAGRRSVSPQNRDDDERLSTNELNATMVQAGKPVQDMSAFPPQYDPGNPIADKQGYIKLPNVNSLVEIMDMREAQKSYEANLNVLDASKTMMSRTVDLLRQ